jgi:NAD(P)-dependent dehydrogenase (short-subunit alcohol dehydrogenase family)
VRWLPRGTGAGTGPPPGPINAIVWLASDAARYVTGITLPIDAGNHLKC